MLQNPRVGNMRGLCDSRFVMAGRHHSLRCHPKNCHGAAGWSHGQPQFPHSLGRQKVRTRTPAMGRGHGVTRTRRKSVHKDLPSRGSHGEEVLGPGLSAVLVVRACRSLTELIWAESLARVLDLPILTPASDSNLLSLC